MDRIEFFQSVDQNKPYDSAITSLFDEFSALYNIVGQYDALKINNITNKNMIQFDVSAIESANIDFIYDQISKRSNIIEIYGQVFQISAIKKSENLIRIRFISKI